MKHPEANSSHIKANGNSCGLVEEKWKEKNLDSYLSKADCVLSVLRPGTEVVHTTSLLPNNLYQGQFSRKNANQCAIAQRFDTDNMQ